MKKSDHEISAAIIDRQLVTESRVMLRHALSSGLRVAPDVLATVLQSAEPPKGDARLWAKAHAQLADMVAPATPRLIAELADNPEDRRPWRRLGNVSLVRQLVFVAIGSLIGFVALNLSPYVHDPRYGNMFASSGLPLLVNELFYLCAAALGASFANLFEAIPLVLRARFDPLSEYFYWVRFLLGLIAGLVLATVLEADIEPQEMTGAGARLGAAGLALVGGFSSNLLYRVLTRLTESVELLLLGRFGAQAPEKERTAAKPGEPRPAEDPMVMARELMELRGQLGDASPELVGRVDALIARMLASAAGSEHEPGALRALPAAAPAAEATAGTADATAGTTDAEGSAERAQETAADTAAAGDDEEARGPGETAQPPASAA
jgi:hypothetical protein